MQDPNNDRNKEIENKFLEIAKELSARTKNPRWAMKARHTINDTIDLYAHASEAEEIVIYKTAEIAYKKYIDYKVGKQ